jgi:hypothetical protein
VTVLVISKVIYPGCYILIIILIHPIFFSYLVLNFALHYYNFTMSVKEFHPLDDILLVHRLVPSYPHHWLKLSTAIEHIRLLSRSAQYIADAIRILMTFSLRSFDWTQMYTGTVVCFNNGYCLTVYHLIIPSICSLFNPCCIFIWEIFLPKNLSFSAP